LYLAWPAFYTDVSDAYRLDRRGRLRTDLGGVYFNVVVILVMVAVYAATRSLEALLLLVVIEHLEIAHQLLPVVRLDGYYIVADLTGVPDLFARIGVILRSLLFWRPADPRLTVLKRWVRVTVTAWVLVVVPLIVLELLIVLIHLPRILGTSWDSAHRLAAASGHAFGHGQVLSGLSDGLQILVLAIPITGILLALFQLFRKGSAWLWRITRDHPARRTLALAGMGAFAALLLLAWIPGRNYHPIQPGERGTQGEGFHALFSLVGGPGPRYSEQAVLHRRGGGTGGRGGGRAGTGFTGPGSRGPLGPANQTPSLVPHSPAGGVPLPTVPAPAGRLVPDVTLPRVTLPPATLPPVTVPRVTVPPTTLPPVTLPPATLPGVTRS
jgi:hypothetical protein